MTFIKYAIRLWTFQLSDYTVPYSLRMAIRCASFSQFTMVVLAASTEGLEYLAFVGACALMIGVVTTMAIAARSGASLSAEVIDLLVRNALLAGAVAPWPTAAMMFFGAEPFLIATAFVAALVSTYLATMAASKHFAPKLVDEAAAQVKTKKRVHQDEMEDVIVRGPKIGSYRGKDISQFIVDRQGYMHRFIGVWAESNAYSELTDGHIILAPGVLYGPPVDPAMCIAATLDLTN